jgi:hypothetical protein
MWSLISPRAKGISGPEKFWWTPQKVFFNTFCQKQTSDIGKDEIGCRYATIDANQCW